MSDTDLKNHQCDRANSWWEHDAQNIPLARVCKLCKKAKLAGFRSKILTGYTEADVDEPIEPQD